MDVASLIDHYNLEPHPEGGFFRESYRADLSGCFEGFDGARNISTGIYFLLPQGTRSALHRIKSDEMWHFYLGGPMTLVEIDMDGTLKQTVLGQDIKSGQHVQHVVPAGVWFGGYPNDGTDYSFVGCTVAPGFDFTDFEMASLETMMTDFPQHENIIRHLCV